MPRHFLPLALGILAFALLTSCYRESSSEEFTVTVTRVTDENAENLATGKLAQVQFGDYMLQNTRFQAIFNGLGETGTRHLYLPKSAGALIDFSTHIRNTSAQGFLSREDDGILAMTQGINMSRGAVVSYDQFRINQLGNSEAELIMTGSVYDFDGSLQAAGFQVHAQTRRVSGIEITTTYKAEELSTSSDVFDDAINQMTVTTVVKNLTNQSLPVFTVNDIMVTKSNGAAPFIPYPDWGFEIPSAAQPRYAYPAFVQIIPSQPNTATYAALSDLEGLMLAGHERDLEKGFDYTFIGKQALESNRLAAQGQLTFVREYYALNNQTTTILESNLNQSDVSAFLTSKLRNSSAPVSLYAETGIMECFLDTKGSTGLRTSIEYIEESISYFNGSMYVKLGPGKTFPIFGDVNVASNYRLNLPIGQIGIRAKLANAPETLITRYTEKTNYPDGTVEERVKPMILSDTTLLTGILSTVEFAQSSSNFTFINTDKRTLYGRVKVEAKAGTPAVNFGNRPIINQGSFAHYLFTSNSGFVNLPAGQYEMLGAHGPLYNVNIQDLNIAWGDPDTTNTDTTETALLASPASFVFNMGKALDWDGYFSADFDVRSSADLEGNVDELLLMRMAYAQDLDVFFTTDLNHQPKSLTRYLYTAQVIGGLDSKDTTDSKLSYLDEVALGRGTAVIGRTNDAYPDRGRFSLLNLPREEDQLYLEIPPFETDPSGFYDAVRQKYPEALIQVSRPRAPKSHETGLFTVVGALSGLGEQVPIPADNAVLNRSAESGSNTKWLDFDLLQILANNHYGEFLLSRADWFNLLSAGVYRPITGGTSGGDMDRVAIGVVRTYAKVATPELRDNDLKEFWSAVKKGNSFVTNGPLIEAKIGQSGFGDAASTASATTLELTVKAAPWIPVKEIRLTIDGVTQIVPMVPTSAETIRFQGNIPLQLGPGNHWIVVEAGATLAELAAGQGETGTFGRVYPGHLPLAISNPIFVR